MELEQLTAEDLDRIFIRAQDNNGRYINVNVAEATDAQFNTWAHSRIPVVSNDDPWSPVERADFCNILYQQGTLHILKKGIDLSCDEIEG